MYHSVLKFMVNLLCGALFPFTLFSQQSKSAINSSVFNGYEITGHIKGLKEGGKVQLKLFYNGVDVPQDSAYIKNGEFHINGIVPGGPRFYSVFADTYPERPFYMRLFVDNNEHITINGDLTNINHSILDQWLDIDGSKAFLAKEALIPLYITYSQNVLFLNNYLQKIKDSVGFDPSLVEAVMKARDIADYTFWNSTLRAPEPRYKLAVPYILEMALGNNGGCTGAHSHILVDAYKALDDQQKNSFYGQRIREEMALCEGQPFPEFTLPTAEGKNFALKDIVAKSKITLVHFWADESFDRKKYQDELRTLYKKYHDKGLNIVGISSDKYQDQWKEALQREQFPWYNVSDLKGKNGVVGTVYHEIGNDDKIHNTTNVLIDDQGKIIAWDASGVVLQWYLWKFFDLQK